MTLREVNLPLDEVLTPPGGGDIIDTGARGKKFEYTFIAACDMLGLAYEESVGFSAAGWDIRPVGEGWHSIIKDRNTNIKVYSTRWLFSDRAVYDAVKAAAVMVKQGVLTPAQASGRVERAVRKTLREKGLPSISFFKPKDKATQSAITAAVNAKDVEKLRKLMVSKNFATKRLGRVYKVKVDVSWELPPCEEQGCKQARKGTWQRTARIHIDGGVGGHQFGIGARVEYPQGRPTFFFRDRSSKTAKAHAARAKGSIVRNSTKGVVAEAALNEGRGEPNLDDDWNKYHPTVRRAFGYVYGDEYGEGKRWQKTPKAWKFVVREAMKAIKLINQFCQWAWNNLDGESLYYNARVNPDDWDAPEKYKPEVGEQAIKLIEKARDHWERHYQPKLARDLKFIEGWVTKGDHVPKWLAEWRGKDADANDVMYSWRECVTKMNQLAAMAAGPVDAYENWLSDLADARRRWPDDTSWVQTATYSYAMMVSGTGDDGDKDLYEAMALMIEPLSMLVKVLPRVAWAKYMLREVPVVARVDIDYESEIMGAAKKTSNWDYQYGRDALAWAKKNVPRPKKADLTPEAQAQIKNAKLVLNRMNKIKALMGKVDWKGGYDFDDSASMVKWAEPIIEVCTAIKGLYGEFDRLQPLLDITKPPRKERDSALGQIVSTITGAMYPLRNQHRKTDVFAKWHSLAHATIDELRAGIGLTRTLKRNDSPGKRGDNESRLRARWRQIANAVRNNYVEGILSGDPYLSGFPAFDNVLDRIDTSLKLVPYAFKVARIAVPPGPYVTEVANIGPWSVRLYIPNTMRAEVRDALGVEVDVWLGERVGAFKRMAKLAYDLYRKAGVGDRALQGPIEIRMRPESEEDGTAGWYRYTTGPRGNLVTVYADQIGFSAFESGDVGLQEGAWTLIHELAHRVYYRGLTNNGRDYWNRLIWQLGKPLKPAFKRAVVAEVQKRRNVRTVNLPANWSGGPDLSANERSAADTFAFWFQHQYANKDFDYLIKWLDAKKFSQGLPTNYANATPREAWPESVANVLLRRKRGSRGRDADGIVRGAVMRLLGTVREDEEGATMLPVITESEASSVRTLLEAGGYSENSAAIMFSVPPNLARQFPAKGEHDPTVPHISALVIGEVGADEWRTVQNVVRQVASEMQPFTVRFGKQGSFDIPGKGQGKIHWVGVESPRLWELHRTLWLRLQDAGIQPAHRYGDHTPQKPSKSHYHAHATLAYKPEGGEFTGKIPQGSWSLRTIEAWRGSRVRVPVKIGGPVPALTESVFTAYHASDRRFPLGHSLDVGHEKRSEDYGIFVTPKRKLVEFWGRHVYRVRVKMRNPLVVAWKGDIPEAIGSDIYMPGGLITKPLAEAIQRAGYDSVVWTDDGKSVGKANEFILFDKSQVEVVGMDESLTERSFVLSDIPDTFRVVFNLGTREKYGDAEAWKGLAMGEMRGLRGISDSGLIEPQWLGIARNAVLEMPGKDVVRLNKVTRIMYDNIHYLLSDDMRAMRRVVQADRHNADRARGHAMRVILDYFITLLRKQGSGDDIRKIVSNWEYAAVGQSISWAISGGVGGKIDNVKDFIKVFNKALSTRKGYNEQAVWKLMQGWDYFTWLSWLRQVAKKTQEVYGTEGEWVIKGDALKIPNGSTLRVLVGNETRPLPERKWQRYLKMVKAGVFKLGDRPSSFGKDQNIPDEWKVDVNSPDSFWGWEDDLESRGYLLERLRALGITKKYRVVFVTGVEFKKAQKAYWNTHSTRYTAPTGSVIERIEPEHSARNLPTRPNSLVKLREVEMPVTALTELFEPKPGAVLWMDPDELRWFRGNFYSDVDMVAEFSVGRSDFVAMFDVRAMTRFPAFMVVDFGKLTMIEDEGRLGTEISFDISGEMRGKASTVFARVGQAIKGALSSAREKVHAIVIRAALNEPSRVALYRRLSKLLARKLGWAGVTTLDQRDGFETFMVYRTEDVADSLLIASRSTSLLAASVQRTSSKVIAEARPTGAALARARAAARKASRTRARMSKGNRIDPEQYANALQGKVRVGSKYYLAGKEAIDAVMALIAQADSPRRKERLRKLLARVKKMTPSSVRASVRGKRPRVDPGPVDTLPPLASEAVAELSERAERHQLGKVGPFKVSLHMEGDREPMPDDVGFLIGATISGEKKHYKMWDALPERLRQGVAAAHTMLRSLNIPDKAMECRIEFVETDTDYGVGFYSPKNDAVFIPLSSLSTRTNIEPSRESWVKTIVHEVGHRIYFRGLGNRGRNSWDEFVNTLGAPLSAEDIRHTVRYTRMKLKPGAFPPFHSGPLIGGYSPEIVSDALWNWFKYTVEYKEHDIEDVLEAFEQWLHSKRYSRGLPGIYANVSPKEAWAEVIRSMATGQPLPGAGFGKADARREATMVRREVHKALGVVRESASLVEGMLKRVKIDGAPAWVWKDAGPAQDRFRVEKGSRGYTVTVDPDTEDEDYVIVGNLAQAEAEIRARAGLDEWLGRSIIVNVDESVSIAEAVVVEPEVERELAAAWDAWRDIPSWEKRGQPAWYASDEVKRILGLGPNDRIPQWVKRLRRRDLDESEQSMNESTPQWLKVIMGRELYRGTAGKSVRAGTGLGLWGAGVYVTWERAQAEYFAELASQQRRSAEPYVHVYRAKPGLNILDSQSREMIEIKAELGLGPWDKMPASEQFKNALTLTVKERGYDGIAGDNQADGIVFFDERSLKLVRSEPLNEPEPEKPKGNLGDALLKWFRERPGKGAGTPHLQEFADWQGVNIGKVFDEIRNNPHIYRPIGAGRWQLSFDYMFESSRPRGEIVEQDDARKRRQKIVKIQRKAQEKSAAERQRTREKQANIQRQAQDKTAAVMRGESINEALKNYVIAFSPVNMKSTVHAAGCTHGEAVQKATYRKSMSRPKVLIPIQATSAQEARRIFRDQEDADDRGMPRTKIANCTKKLGEAAACPTIKACTMPIYGGLPEAGGFNCWTQLEVGAQRIAEATHCILGSIQKTAGHPWRYEVGHIAEEIGIIVDSQRDYGQRLYVEIFDEHGDGAKSVDSMKANAPKLRARAKKWLAQHEQWFPEDALATKCIRLCYELVIALSDSLERFARTWKPGDMRNPIAQIKRETDALQREVSKLLKREGPTPEQMRKWAAAEKVRATAERRRRAAYMNRLHKKYGHPSDLIPKTGDPLEDIMATLDPAVNRKAENDWWDMVMRGERQANESAGTCREVSLPLVSLKQQ